MGILIPVYAFLLSRPVEGLGGGEICPHGLIRSSKAIYHIVQMEERTVDKKLVPLGVLLALSLSWLAGCSSDKHTKPDTSTPITSQVAEDTSSVTESEPIEQVNNATPTLADLTNDHLLIFETISEMNLDEVKQGQLTIEELDAIHNDLIEVYIVEGQLPSNAHTLYDEWKDSIGYYNRFTGTNANSNANTNTNAGSGTNVDTSNPNTPSTEVPVVSGGNNANTNTSTKPKPSVPQQQQQVENNGGGMTQEEKEALAAEHAGKVEINESSGGKTYHAPSIDEFVEELPDWMFE